MIEPAARVGDAVAAIDTPALVVDLDAMERNLAAMAGFAREHGIRLRPHAKMHKCAAIARLQIAAGAVGVCVQKLSEAQALAAAGIGDILITNEIVDPRKLEQVSRLAGGTRLGICVDSELGIERLAEAVHRAGSRLDVYVEIDVGQGRCGAAAERAAELAGMVQRHTAAKRGLRFAGLQAYHGGAQHLRSEAERRAAIAAALAVVQRALAALDAAGIENPLVTGAGTGSFGHEAASGIYGELQAGSYLFMDADYAANQPAADVPRFEHALFVKSQVVSSGNGRAVVDAGHKSHAIDSGLPLVWQRRGLRFANGGDEHGILAAGDDGEPLPGLGETVWLVPGHCDPTVNLHEQLIAVRGGLDDGVVEAVWVVDARGCLR
ncbi:DSD1 family PLP-dependent enzyme [Piscinibacter sakaiensis]|uniref:DSD1 family PLP-dependent enzyme n=1 Tax=Piscinibacter sakaiensis TaxID=1547922 RepID=UPI003AAF790E